MPVNHDLWWRSFPKGHIPALPCPECNASLALDGEIRSQESTHSINLRKEHPEWDTDLLTENFSMHLKCVSAACGQIVVVGGAVVVDEVHFEDEDGYNSKYETMLAPSSMYPAPPLFKVPANTPAPVQSQLKLAFQFFWADFPSCLARVRTSVELVLDEQSVPSEKLNANGIKIPINLSERIDLYKSQTGDGDSADSLNALRLVGNLGTHETKVSKEALFDALDVYEDVLTKIYTNHSIHAKKAKLLQTKGKY